MIPAHPDMAISYEVLGHRLARLRRSQGLSKTDLADRLGVTVTSICYWERANHDRNLGGLYNRSMRSQRRSPSQTFDSALPAAAASSRLPCIASLR